MKLILTLIINVAFANILFAQQDQLTFNHQNIDFSAAPRTTINPMSIKLWDNYNNGGPTAYGTVMEFYGLYGHQTGQFYFAGWDNSKIRYREAFWSQNSWSDWMTLLDSKNNVESTGRLMITGQGNHYINGGNVGIGISNPAEKLSVNGNIRAKEVKVEAANWPDYVFEEGYKVGTLQELESYIKANKHLPDMPSAKEIDVQGLQLGEMVKMQQKKIEELTLQLIELNKKVLTLQQKHNKPTKH
jgi:hypothetical protein